MGEGFGSMFLLAMNSFTSRTVLLSLVSSLALAFAPQAAAQQADGAELAKRETARRQQAMRDSMLKVQEARTAYTEGKYGVAVDCYRRALSKVPESPATEKQVKFIKDSLADALVAKGMDYRKVGRTDEAVEFMKEALQLSPGHKFAAAELEKTLDPVRTNPALTPRHIGNVGEVNRLLSLAFGFDIFALDGFTPTSLKSTLCFELWGIFQLSFSLSFFLIRCSVPSMLFGVQAHFSAICL